ncbi:MAG: hypothetical protein Q8R74_01820 [Methylophilus sp.]|jgi:hypothetical protein|nr:hypothetical protein [Methylophilus sp.]
MTLLPLVMRKNQKLSNHHKFLIAQQDELTIDEPLPAILDLKEGGYKVERSTRVTEVNRETTDDN